MNNRRARRQRGPIAPAAFARPTARCPCRRSAVDRGRPAVRLLRLGAGDVGKPVEVQVEHSALDCPLDEGRRLFDKPVVTEQCAGQDLTVRKKTSINSRDFFIVLPLTIFGTVMLTHAHASENHYGAPQVGVTTGATKARTITRDQRAGNRLTPQEMRSAKPLPMPNIEGPPVPEQTVPTPYTEPPGSTPPGFGGSARR
jgi:hypothetical protein